MVDEHNHDLLSTKMCKEIFQRVLHSSLSTSKMLLITGLFFLSLFDNSLGYDPSAEQLKRLNQFRKTCEKYSDDLTYEHHGMYDHDPSFLSSQNVMYKTFTILKCSFVWNIC